jgi:hypothetical protein
VIEGPAAPTTPDQEKEGKGDFSLTRQGLPLLLALGCAFLGQQLFQSRKVLPALVLWGAALLIFLFLRPWRLWAGPSSPEGKREWVLLSVFLGVAALMRFPFLGEHFTGLQVDEGHCVMDGFEFSDGILESPFVTTGWGANASFHFWWLGRFMEIFGQSVAVARGFSALLSLGVLFLFYRLSRAYFGTWPSLLAAFLMSVGWWFLFYSLSPFQNMLVVFWQLLTFLFLLRALRDGKKLDFALAGLFLAMMEMEYLPGRLGVLMVALILGGCLLVEGPSFLRARLRGLSLTFLTMLWWMGPFIRYAIENMEHFLGRAKNLNLLAEVQRTGDWGLILEKWAWTLLSFFHRNGGADLRFSAQASMIDPVGSALFLVGLLLLLFHLRKWPSWFLLSGLLFGLFANAMAIQGKDPDPTYINGQRFFIVVPFLFLLGAGALEALFRVVRRAPPLFRWAGAALLLAACFHSLQWNARHYYKGFRDFKACTSYWGDLGFNHVQVAEFINGNYSRCHLIVDWEYDSSTVKVLTRGHSKYQSLARVLEVPIRRKVDRNVLILTLRWNFTGIQDGIRRHYPKAKWGTIANADGHHDLVTIEIDKDDIEALQKGGALPEALP